jgi:hypothetical protein
MLRTTVRALGACILLTTLLAPLTASAHEEVNVGKYTLEIGWVNEPVLLGESNGVFLSVGNSETGEPVEGLTTLQVAITTGGQTRDLELHPLGEDAPGQYAADFIPTVRGQYTVKLTGKIEEQDVDLTQEIEEVEVAEDYQFPVTLPSLPEMSKQLTDLQAENQSLRASATLNQWLAMGGIVLGLAGLAVGVVSLRRK